MCVSDLAVPRSASTRALRRRRHPHQARRRERSRPRLSDRQLGKLNVALQAGDPNWEVTLAWHAYQRVRAIYQAPDPIRGRRIAEDVIATFPTCPVPEIARLGRTLRAWKAHILARFDTAEAGAG